MIIVALGAIVLAVFVGAAILVVIVRALRLLARIGIALIFGAGFGIIAALIAGVTGIDGTAAGLAIGLLGFAVTYAWYGRSKEHHPFSSPSRQHRINGSKALRPIPPVDGPDTKGSLVETTLAKSLATATRDVHQAVAANPLDMDLVDWCGVLERVPELIAETEALARTASPAELSVLRAQLAEDLNEITTEAERRLMGIRRQRHAVLRRWVAIRTGRN